MFDKFVARVQQLTARVVAWQVNNHYERCAMRLLEKTHLGASVDWLTEIVEVRGRHALAVATHH